MSALSHKKGQGAFTLIPFRIRWSIFSDARQQCDEARPRCGSCRKRHFECAYELPVGQTRTQALIQSQQDLRGQMRSHVSFIYALRSVGSNEATQMLCRLRKGDYDGSLLGERSTFGQGTGPTSEDFPSDDLANGHGGYNALLGPDFSTGQHRITHAYTTPYPPYPSRMSLDKILVKSGQGPRSDDSIPTH
jgi:hypothetical protein